MILIDNTKYSCIECIRGHRSSLCRHHTRPLLQVRSKGRPNISTNGNPNYRIAVFAEQIQTEMTEQDQDMTGDNGGCETTNLNTEGSKKCKSKASPVVILKSSPKQVIDLVSGEIIGPYKNSNGSIVKTEANSNGSAPINGVIKQEVADQIVNIKQESSIKSCCKNDNASKCTSSDSLISKFANQNFSIPSKSLSQQGNTSSCCANKVSKSNCKCSNGSKTINKSKILRTYLQNHLMKLKDWNTNESMEQQQLQQQQREQQQQLQQQNISAYSNVFQATLLPLLNAIQQPELQFCSAPTPKIPQQQLDGDYSFNNVKQEITPRNSIEETPPPPESGGIYDVVNIPACSIPGTCCCGDSCSCAGCVVHGNPAESISQQFESIQQQPHQVILTESKQSSNYNNYAFSELFNIDFNETENRVEDSPSSSNGGVCSCPNDSCDCQNCEVHGIINGTKLDELFYDPKNQQQFHHQQPIQPPRPPTQQLNQQLTQVNGNVFPLHEPNNREIFDYANYILNSILNKDSLGNANT